MTLEEGILCDHGPSRGQGGSEARAGGELHGSGMPPSLTPCMLALALRPSYILGLHPPPCSATPRVGERGGLSPQLHSGL